MSDPVVRMMRLAHSEGLTLPDYQTAGAAGFDLFAAIPRLQAKEHARKSGESRGTRRRG